MRRLNDIEVNWQSLVFTGLVFSIVFFAGNQAPALAAESAEGSTTESTKDSTQGSTKVAAGDTRLDDSYAEHLDRGIQLYKLGDYEGALDSLTKAKNLDPKEPMIHRGLAKVLTKLHRYSEAETEYQTVISLEPTNPNNTTDLGALYLDQGKYQNANSLFQHVLSQDPSNINALWGKAVSLEATEDLSGAGECYEQLIKEHPNSSEAQSAQIRLKHIEKAKTAEANNRFFPIDPAIGEAGFGWWNLKHMPLHVYVDSGDNVVGYRSEMRAAIQKAFDAWSLASRGAITFSFESNDFKNEAAWQAIETSKSVLRRLDVSETNMPPDPVPCDIHIHWSEVSGIGHGALGRTWTSRLKTGDPVLTKAHIWIATNCLADGSIMPATLNTATIALYESQDRMLEEVITHELGHALGLPHSPNPNDLMFGGVYGLNAQDLVEQRQLSTRDQNSLAEHYGNFEGTGIPLADNSRLLEESAPSPDAGTPPASNTPDASPPTSAPAPQAGNAPDAGQPATDATPQDGNAPGSTGQATDGNAPDATAGGDADKNPDKADNSGDDDKDKDKDQDKADNDQGNSSSRADAHGPYSPMKEAMFDLNTKQYTKCLDKLNGILAATPNLAQAHYLKGVVYVMLRQYTDAANEYKLVLRLAPGSPLSAKAQTGLKNLRL